jgi:aspartate--ammonia ligase
VILREDRVEPFLVGSARRVIEVLKKTEQILRSNFRALLKLPLIEENMFVISTAELEAMYPDLSPREREDAITKEKKTVFLTQIGGKLKNGKPHDGRAPDYDDWKLNGDLLIWYPVLDRAVEISSMGIRVDAESLKTQLEEAGCEDRMRYDFHKALLRDELPLTIGGGIGQSRVCMLLLGKAHIGEVQASLWPKEMVKACEENGIFVL